MAMGGDLQVQRGKAETISYNPYLPNNGETVMFRGPSHDNGGMPISFGENGVEVEGGEPAMVMKNGGKQDNLVVFGNMRIPDYGANEIGDEKAKGMKFKRYVADLSKQESKYNKTMDKSIKLVNDSDTHNPFDQLSFNSGRAMLTGSQMYLKDIAGKKLNTSAVQNAILDTAEEYGLDSARLAQQSMAKFGGKFSFDDIAKDGTKKGKGKPVTNVSKKSNSLPTVKPYKETNTLQSFVKNVPFAERKAMGKSMGIPNFKGTVEQNQFLFNKTQQSDRAPLRGPFDYTNSLEKIPVTALNKAISAGDYGKNNPSYSGYPKPEREDSNIPWETIAQSAMSNIYPFIRPTSARPLDPSQLAPEMLAASMNQQQPVAAQLYNPMLTQATSISLQDQLNEVTAQSRSAERMAAYNPEAASMIFAQVSDAKNKILGEQFRMNQAEKQRVSQQNTSLLNDAQLKNLGALDQQYARQSQAESNTKQQSIAIANSIAAKIAQNKLENRQATTMENMYPDFSFTGSGRAYKNPFTMASFTPGGGSSKNEKGTLASGYGYTYDENRNIIGTRKLKSEESGRNGLIVKAFKNF
jgi:hypothetical protein